MQTATLLADVEKHVRDLFFQYQHPYLIYHNFAHTSKVVTRTKEIAEFYKYNELNKFIVIAAAWFHDTGHLPGNMEWNIKTFRHGMGSTVIYWLLLPVF